MSPIKIATLCVLMFIMGFQFAGMINGSENCFETGIEIETGGEP